MSNVFQLNTSTASPLATPISIETEQALLGALLMNNAVLPQVQSILEPEHFSEELHRRIYATACDMVQRGQVASPITLAPYLPQDDLGDGMTAARYMARLAAGAVTIAAAPSYARTVRDLALRRRMVEIGAGLADRTRAADIGDDPAMLAAEALAGLQIIAATGRAEDTRRDVGDSAAALIARARDIRDGTVADAGISTGIPDLDHATGGLQPGTLWIVGGRPGLGKTIMATGFANKVGQRGYRDLRDGKDATGAMLFSLELGESQIMARLMADLAYDPHHAIAYSQIVRGDLQDDDLWRLEDAEKRLRQMPLALDVASRLTVQEIAARVRAEKTRMASRGARLGVVFVDYLKMVAASDRYRGQRVYEVGEISGGLKQLAKDEGICVVLLAQLNRLSAAHDRKDKRPTLVDLRESGDLEADADVVAFIHRESYYIAQSADYRAGIPEAVDAFIASQYAGEIIVGKTRLGAPGTVPIWISVGCSTFAAHARGQG